MWMSESDKLEEAVAGWFEVSVQSVQTEASRVPVLTRSVAMPATRIALW